MARDAPADGLSWGCTSTHAGPSRESILASRTRQPAFKGHPPPPVAWRFHSLMNPATVCRLSLAVPMRRLPLRRPRRFREEGFACFAIFAAEKVAALLGGM